jgi:hypothetical protein
MSQKRTNWLHNKLVSNQYLFQYIALCVQDNASVWIVQQPTEEHHGNRTANTHYPVSSLSGNAPFQNT